MTKDISFIILEHTDNCRLRKRIDYSKPMNWNLTCTCNLQEIKEKERE